VQILGYINTDGGNTNNVTVRKEIETYVGCMKVSESPVLSGVYFDKTPWKDEGNARAYLGNVTATVLQSEGLGAVPVVVHNPGRIPDKELALDEANITVNFEGSCAEMPNQYELHDMLKASEGARQYYAMLVHSVPQSIRRTGLRKIVENTRRDVECLYVTGLTDDVYE
jgi:hypothetical protein